MNSNVEFRNIVLQAINSKELLVDECIDVCANNGVIILTGTVDSYIKKIEAVDVAQNTEGVKSVIDNIEVQYGCLPKISDTEISVIVLNAINWNWEFPCLKISVSVLKGQVTLEGEVQLNFQKEVAAELIVNLAGVRKVINNIHIIANATGPKVDDNREKRLHNHGNKLYVLDAAGRLSIK